MKFWRKWFNTVPTAPVPYQDEIKAFTQEPEDNVPDISEPVTSFIKCFNSNPRRFKLNTDEEVYRPFRTYHFTFKDKVTLEEWKVRYAPGYYTTKIDNADFLTEDEQQLIIKTVYKYHIERSQKINQIKHDRKNRELIKERTRLTNIYKED